MVTTEQAREYRFIPAGAGNICSHDILLRPSPVYPRWRGEHVEYKPYRDVVGGLSPLARGTSGLKVQIFVNARFIPAGAGNILSVQPADVSDPVYPRWRGEYGQSHNDSTPRRGLSPLARGIFKPFIVVNILRRFIPAGAGNMAMRFVNVSSSAVYPRWRGEYWSRILAHTYKCGLSPLARGIFDNILKGLLDSRFIPAGAGNIMPPIGVNPD